jgi:ferredoxin
MPNLKVIIDRRKCSGEAICVGIAPEVFDLDEEGIAIVINPEGADEETLLEAMESCPQDAITLIEEEEELAA